MVDPIEHDFSPVSGFCVECALPRTAQAVPCRPSTADDPVSCAELAREAENHD
jgi:hypothetical protein